MCTCTEKDLPELLSLLHCVRAKWESMATQLGLSQGDIEAIALKRSHDPDDCLKEVITLWLRGVDPVPTREQLARALQSPPVGREDIAQQVVPGLSKLPPKLSEVDPVQLARRPLQSPPVGREDIAQQVVPGLSKLPPKLSEVDPVQLARCPLQSPPVGREDIAHLQQVVFSLSNLPKNSKFWLVCLCSILLALVVIYQDSSPRKSLSLPVRKQELIGREEEMKVIMDYFKNSKVNVVTLFGQAGFGKSEIALHVGHRMLQLGLDVHYIRVEDFKNVSSLEKELMEISGMSKTSMELKTWAKGLTKFNKTLLILDNVDGQHWVNNTSSHRQLKELFLNPLLDSTNNLQVLITSQQDMMTKQVYRSYRLYSLSTNDCVHLMMSESDTADTGDLTVICD